MNHDYIDQLINRNRTGVLIKLIKANVHKWSVNNFQYIFEQCIKNKLYHVFHFMMNHFIMSNCISFYENDQKIKTVYSSCVFEHHCMKGNMDIVKHLLICESNKNHHYNLGFFNSGTYIRSGLLNTCRCGAVNIVKYLLSDIVVNKYPDSKPYIPDVDVITISCFNGHINILKYVLTDEIVNKYPVHSRIEYNLVEGLHYAHKEKCKKIINHLLCDEIVHKYPKIHSSHIDKN